MRTTTDRVYREVSSGRMTVESGLDLLDREQKNEAVRLKLETIAGWVAVVLIGMAVLFASVAFADNGAFDKSPAIDGLVVPAGGTLVLPPAAPAPAPAGPSWLEGIVALALAILTALGTFATKVLLPAAKLWLRAQADDKNASTGAKLLAGATIKLETFIEAGLVHVWHVFEADMKKAAADGVITKEERQAAIDHVLAEVKTYLGTEGLAQLGGVLGFGGEMLDKFIKSLIEKKVQAAQQAGSIAAAGVTNGMSAAAALSSL